MDDVRADMEIKRIEDEQYLLNIEDLYGVFVIWALGLATAGFVLILEVFWFDCLRQLRITFIYNYFERARESEKHVSRIQVAPMHEVHN